MDGIFKPSSWTVWDVYHHCGISFCKRYYECLLLYRTSKPRENSKPNCTSNTIWILRLIWILKTPSEFWVPIKQPQISILETRRWNYLWFKILAGWRTVTIEGTVQLSISGCLWKIQKSQFSFAKYPNYVLSCPYFCFQDCQFVMMR